MNCQNCAAPLTQSAGPLRMVCTFCQTVQTAPDLTALVDRVRVIGERQGGACPACDGDLVSALVEDGRACYCQQCHGVLLFGPEFRRVVEARRAAYSGPELAVAPAHPIELNRQLRCPSCTATMEVHPYYGAGRAVIDSCAACQLVWVDRGELTSLEQSPGRRSLPILETIHLVADAEVSQIL